MVSFTEAFLLLAREGGAKILNTLYVQQNKQNKNVTRNNISFLSVPPQLLVNYNQFRRKHVAFFRSLKASHLRPVFEDGLPLVSPVRDHLGRTLVFLLAGCWNTKLYTFQVCRFLGFLGFSQDFFHDFSKIFGILETGFTGPRPPGKDVGVFVGWLLEH